MSDDPVLSAISQLQAEVKSLRAEVKRPSLREIAHIRGLDPARVDQFVRVVAACWNAAFPPDLMPTELEAILDAVAQALVTQRLDKASAARPAGSPRDP